MTWAVDDVTPPRQISFFSSTVPLDLKGLAEGFHDSQERDPDEINVRTDYTRSQKEAVGRLLDLQLSMRQKWEFSAALATIETFRMLTAPVVD
ncbi:hypothetical protein PM082_016863 [Marasmius tenuissimus]|nr:hypothetical protein PM082_016863 [Marasmius tenuissimus]